MSLHSKFLIHWTGRDFDQTGDVAHITTNHRAMYVQRLRDTCQRGLYMRIGSETIYGVNNTCVTAGIARVCFSEIRLSVAHKHAGRHGKLGIGVSRDLVLDREGNPVFYVQNGSKGHVIENLGIIYARSGPEVRKMLEVVTGYLKNMGERESRILDLYDEMEWRVVHVDRLEKEGYIVPEDKEKGVFRLKLQPTDMKVLVFPDEKTRILAMSDPDLARFFGDRWPIAATLSDCDSF